MEMAKKMKTLVLLTAMVVIFNLVGVLSVSATTVYDYSGAWYSTDGDSNFLNFNYGSTTQTFYLLNDNNVELEVLSGAGGTTAYLTKDANIWYAGNNPGDLTLNLGSTGHFWFKYGNLTSYDYEIVQEQKIYNLSFDDGGQSVQIVTGIDIAPVPIPGAALLLGSGLLGLGWLKVRRRSKLLSD
jgi:hypothetical protein